jgi:hypothetical protein
VREAEIDTWLSSAPPHQVRTAHTEAALALNEWRERITRPGEQCCLASSGGAPTRSIVAAAGRAALELAIIVASHRPP